MACNDMTGFSVVVMGASRGIGAGVAEELGRRGARLTLVARSESALHALARRIKAATGSECLPVAVDITDADGLTAMMSLSAAMFGPVSVIVNTAGKVSSIGPINGIDSHEWHADIVTNIFGAYNLMRAALPGMIAQDRGWIFNFSSALALSSAPYLSSYVASKAAINALTRCVADELAGTNVKVYSISPGLVKTDMFMHAAFSPEGKRWMPHLSKLPDEAFSSPVAVANIIVDIVTGKREATSGSFIPSL